MIPFRLVLLLALMAAGGFLRAQQGCTASSPLVSFKLYVKPQQHAAYPLREVNELVPGMKIQYQPLQVPGSDPEDARIALILAESIRGAETQRLLVMEPQRADHVAEWEVPFRTEIVALVFGPQGLSESKMGNLIKKDASLVKELAIYAEQNQRMEDLIQLLADNERAPRAGESLDAALSGFAARHGMPMARLDREAPTSEQAMLLMRTLNPTLSSFDPLAPSPTQRVAQSAGLAASVAGLVWGSQVALYAGGAGLFLNMRSLLFPGTEFRSALLQAGEDERLSLCARSNQQRSRTRTGYLWAARIPDAAPPAITFAQKVHAGAGLEATLPVRLGEGAQWRHVARAQQWRLLSADGTREYPVTLNADSAAGALRFPVPASAEPGLYQLAARWDWQILRPNGFLQVHTVESGAGAVLSQRSLGRLLEGARDVEIALERGNFRFVEQATFKRKADPYSTPRVVPHRLVERRGSEDLNLFVMLNGAPLERGMWQLTLRQTGGKELQVDVPVLPQPPTLSNLPLRLNVGVAKAIVRLEGQRLELIDTVEAEGVVFRPSGTAGASADRPRTTLEFEAEVSPELAAGARLDLKLRLKDRPDPVLLQEAIAVMGPLPQLLSSRVAHQESGGIALREGEMPMGGLVTTLLGARHAHASSTLVLGCRDGAMQVEALSLKPGQTSRDARLQMSSAESLYLTFDPGRVGQHGCQLEARLQTDTGVSAPLPLGRVVRLPKLESLALTDEAMGANLFAAILIGQDLEAIAAVGWDPLQPVPVKSIPRPREGDSRKQELRISLPWPSPTPRAPMFIWLPEETEGRLTSTRAGA